MWQDEVTVEGEGASIMEIREWLDDAEQQTSVEVIDIGKVSYHMIAVHCTWSLSDMNALWQRPQVV